MAIDPITGSLLVGGASGATSGLFGLFGNKDQGVKDPDFLDFQNLFNIWWASMNATEQRRVQEEYQQRADQLNQDIIRVAQEGPPESLRLYDAGAEAGLSELEALRQRTMAAGGRLPQSAEAQRRAFLSDYDRRAQNAQAGYQGDIQGFLNQLAGSNQDILGGYEDRYKKAEAELTGYGEQRKADVDRRFEERYGAIAQDLVSRGLASSTESAKQQLLNTELQSSEQRRLGEDLTRNRINVLGGMSGEQLAAQERMSGQRAGYQYGGIQSAAGRNAQLEAARAAFDAAARGDVENMKRLLIQLDQQSSGDLANAQFAVGTNRSNIFTQGQNTLLNALSSINYIPAPANNLNQMFGQNAAPVPQSASPWPSFWGNAAQGFGQLGGALAYNAFQPAPPMQVPQTSFGPGAYGSNAAPYGGGQTGYGPQFMPPAPPAGYGYDWWDTGGFR